MMVLQVVPDRFAAKAESLSSSLASGGTPTAENHIRRPTRGIVLKEDTFATLRLVAGVGGNLKLVDAGSRRKEFSGEGNQVGYMTSPDGSKRATDIYSNFLLQSVQEERMEKSQIVETFGEPYIFLFGERARVMTFSGVLANTFDFNWEAEWWHNYENYLRGTRCVEMDARVFLSFDNTLVGGYLVSTASAKAAEQRNFVQFQFQLFVTSYANYSDVGNPSALPPGAREFVDVGAGQDLDISLDPAIAAQFRPQVLSDFGRFPLSTNGLKIGSGALLDDIDFSAIEFAPEVDAAINAISEVWNEGARIVNRLAQGIEDLATGARVRVPIGFEGSLAFDEDADVHLKEVVGGGVIRFTSFADNLDEYVGSSDHYGSSSPALVHLSSLTSPSQASEIARAQEMVTKAEEIWKAQGLEIPTEKMSEVSSFLVSKGLGLVGVGATKAWTTAASPGGVLNPEGRLPLSVFGDTGVRDPSTPE